MGSALLLGRLLLATVFLVAGVAKLADLSSTRQAVLAFGVPGRIAPTVAVVLPAVEIAVGAALVPLASAPFGALGAAALLAFFIGAVVNALVHGRAPECHCFGQVHSAPVGRRTLARNVALFAVAGFVAVAGWGNAGLSATAWMTHVDRVWLVMIAAGLVIGVLLLLQVRFWFQVLEQNGRILARLEALERAPGAATVTPGRALDAQFEPGLSAASSGGGLPIGAAAPGFELDTLDGERLSLDLLLARGRPLLLVFSDAGCGPCAALLPQVAGWQREYEERLEIAVIASGGRERNQAKAGPHGVSQLLLQVDGEVSAAYRAHGTPTAVVIGAGGVVMSPTVAGALAIRRLVEQTASPADALGRGPYFNGQNGTSPPPAPALGVSRVGEPAPELVLADLDGRPIELRDLYRRPMLAIFWDPGCGFCQRMLADLKALEDALPAGAPQLVVFSSGDPDGVRQQQIRSLVLLDPDRQAMRAFGAGGTPMGVLVDERARIASAVLGGAAAVLAGARGDPQPVPTGG